MFSIFGGMYKIFCVAKKMVCSKGVFLDMSEALFSKILNSRPSKMSQIGVVDGLGQVPRL